MVARSHCQQEKSFNTLKASLLYEEACRCIVVSCMVYLHAIQEARSKKYRNIRHPDAIPHWAAALRISIMPSIPSRSATHRWPQSWPVAVNRPS